MDHYLLIMHDDVETETVGKDWGAYIEGLKKGGRFVGGSSVGGGFSFKKGAASEAVSHWIGGYMILNAASLEDAKSLVVGNPVLKCGGTVEIRELPRD